MDAYVEMGCRPTWTCAPYQLSDRPAFGEHIAWAESNAVVFANSVIGARANRYGDFIDICAAITGRVPATRYHLDEGRRAEIVVDVTDIPAEINEQDIFFALLGHVVGRIAAWRVPAIVGIVSSTEDQLKALGAAAAASGAVGLLHIIGVTPEAPTLDAVFDGPAPVPIRVGSDQLRQARSELGAATGAG